MPSGLKRGKLSIILRKRILCVEQSTRLSNLCNGNFSYTVQVYIHCTVEYHMLLGAVSKSYQCEESTAHAALTIQQSFQAYENFRRKFPDCEKSFTFKSRCFIYLVYLPAERYIDGNKNIFLNVFHDFCKIWINIYKFILILLRLHYLFKIFFRICEFVMIL